jgi:hypothetical protein
VQLPQARCQEEEDSYRQGIPLLKGDAASLPTSGPQWRGFGAPFSAVDPAFPRAARRRERGEVAEVACSIRCLFL